jgi:hypothetical protein
MLEADKALCGIGNVNFIKGKAMGALAVRSKTQ